MSSKARGLSLGGKGDGSLFRGYPERPKTEALSNQTNDGTVQRRSARLRRRRQRRRGRPHRPPRQLGAVSVAPAHDVPRVRPAPRPIESSWPQGGFSALDTVGHVDDAPMGTPNRDAHPVRRRPANEAQERLKSPERLAIVRRRASAGPGRSGSPGRALLLGRLAAAVDLVLGLGG